VESAIAFDSRMAALKQSWKRERHRLVAQKRKEAREGQPDVPKEDAIVVDVRLAALLDVPETRPEWQQNVSRHAAANASNHDAQMLQYTALGESENANNTGPSVE
jgi:hypothetical protein